MKRVVRRNNNIKQREVWVKKYTPLQQKRIDNNECPNCGKPKSKWTRRTDWTCCSKKCSEEFYDSKFAVLDWKEIRKQAFKRDKNTCVWCGEKEDNTSALVGDHIIPIAIGGDEFDIDNVQTLCHKCNKKKTKRDAFVIAQRRRVEKLNTKVTQQEKLIQA